MDSGLAGFRPRPGMTATSLGLVIAAVPGKEAARAGGDEELAADAEGSEQQHADKGVIVLVGARLVQDEIAEAADRGEELGNHCADQRAAGGEPQPGQEIWRRRRQ